MAIYYYVKQRIDPTKRDQAPKWYAQAKVIGTAKEKEIAERIATTCTVKYADIVAVLTALEDEIVFALQSGNTVAIPQLGAWSAKLHSLGSETEKEFDLSYIKGCRVRFRPAREMEFDLKNPGVQLEKRNFTYETSI